ncbi:chaplin family protein [Streptomyces sp. CA-294286]|uniref:chaplin n=1 Tax=Streptomyces sp. CA-294286 TaxID=3240070 RepID=UPI003D8B6465
MRQVTKKGLISFAAAGGVLALGGGHAHADSGADGTASNSPGVLSGNSLQVPVHVPVNACGNTASVVGVLNPAMGNACANKSEPAKHGHPGQPHRPGPAEPGTHSEQGSSAHGNTTDSPGVGSGNNIKVPVHVPVNACGNSVDVIGLLNPTFGNDCTNQSGPATPDEPQTPDEPKNPGNPDIPHTPGDPVSPGQPRDRAIPSDPSAPHTPNAPEAQTVAQAESTEALAQTGASDSLGIAVPAGAGLLLAGAILYRRARSAA